jgi:hypothetical protein
MIHDSDAFDELDAWIGGSIDTKPRMSQSTNELQESFQRNVDTRNSITKPSKNLRGLTMWSERRAIEVLKLFNPSNELCIASFIAASITASSSIFPVWNVVDRNNYTHKVVKYTIPSIGIRPQK